MKGLLKYLNNAKTFKDGILNIVKPFASKGMTFEKLSKYEKIYLYAGDIPTTLKQYEKFIGLSLLHNDERHIKHDISQIHNLPENMIDIYQSEDVFEHIPYDKLLDVINDIYRILKPGGVFRLSLPDYRCDYLYGRSIKDNLDKVIFDPGGGGYFKDGVVLGGGHLWFPTFELVRDLLHKTFFHKDKIKFFHYYDENGKALTKEIDYSIGFVQRTPDNDERVKNPYRPMSIVVDCIKSP